MRRSARVVAVARVSVPATTEPAIRVTTDYHRQDERAFYLRPDSPLPELGGSIVYGDHHAWYGGHVARKVGYNFDPAAPLR